MRAVTGVFTSASDAQRVARELHAVGLAEDKVALLLPGEGDHCVPISAGEQPGVGKVKVGRLTPRRGPQAGWSWAWQLAP